MQGEAGLSVGLNGWFWSQERTGSGQYLRHLYAELGRSQAEQYFLLAPTNRAMTEVDLMAVRRQPVPPLIKRGGEKVSKVWWEQTGLPRLVQAQPALDVVHYPYFAAPLAKLPAPTGLIVTIHDLIPLALAEYAASLPSKLYFRLVSAAARQADLIMADSEYSKQDILRFLKVPPRKVQVVYLGADARYQAGFVSEETRRALYQRHGLEGDERIVFYLGGFDRRKNLTTLIEAFGQALPALKEQEKTDKGGRWTLAIGGKPHTDNPQMYPDLSGPVQRSFGTGSDSQRVRFLGAVDEADKPLLYRAADIFAFPSTYEGFGLDPLEAMASGTPVICSNATCLPEVVGQAGKLLPPTEVAAWRDALIELAASPAKRAILAEAGIAQAAKFTWQKTAERTLQLYNVVQCVRTRGVSK